jgi:predicted Zn finger-like uncharacterized protein
MDVRCDRCQTEYEFDEARLTETGVAVRCTACGNVFKVSRPVAAAAPIDLERPRQWKVRRNDGQVYALKDLPELQRWIVERRVSRDDEVSLSGDAWRKLGGMPELASFFDIVEAAELAQHKAAAEAAGSSATMSGQTASPAAPAAAQARTSSPTPAWGSPAAHPSTGSATPKLSEPAWASSPTIPAFDDDLGDDDLKHVRSSPWPTIVLVLIVLGGLGGGGFFVMKQMQRNQPATTPAAPPAGPETGAAAAPPAPGPMGATGATAPEAAVAPSGPAGSPTPGATGPATAASPAPAAPTGAEAKPAAPDTKTVAEATTPQKPETKPDSNPEAKPDARPDSTPEAKSGKEKPAAKPDGKAEGGDAPKGGHDFNWYVTRGRKLLDTHPSQALGMFEQASQLNSSSPEPDSGRGIAYSNLEQWPKAITAFQAAIQKSPEFSEAVMGLAEAYRYKGDKTQALVYYKKYLALTPDGADAPAAKAQIQSLKGE